MSLTQKGLLNRKPYIPPLRGFRRNESHRIRAQCLRGAKGQMRKHHGYDSHQKRSQLRTRGIRPQFPKRAYKSKKHLGRPIKNDTPRFQQERCFSWYQKKYRRLVVRWERQSSVFDGFLALGMIHIWINKIILVG